MAGNFLKYGRSAHRNRSHHRRPELIAISAPARIFIGAGATQGDGWAERKGMFVSAAADRPVYKSSEKRSRRNGFPPIETTILDGTSPSANTLSATPPPQWQPSSPSPPTISKLHDWPRSATCRFVRGEFSRHLGVAAEACQPPSSAPSQSIHLRLYARKSVPSAPNKSRLCPPFPEENSSNIKPPPGPLLDVFPWRLELCAIRWA